MLREFRVSEDQGLHTKEVKKRRKKHGKNKLRQSKSPSFLVVIWNQINSIVIYLLIGAAVLAFLTGRLAEGVAVTTVILINGAIGFISEWQALKSMEALRHLTEHQVTVKRDGKEVEVPAEELVPGDIALVRKGALVPADLRILNAEKLRIDESSLTGESVPVDKSADPVGENSHLAERHSMLFKGTSIVRGSAEAVVVSTGDNTELGRISTLAEEAEASVTLLQKRLDKLGHRLAWLTVGIAVFVVLVGSLIRNQEMTLILETALALGIAAIPEGLPIVATIALARGMRLMAKRNALVNKLTAVETLGATTVTFSDKTGTLTENKMMLRKVWIAENEDDVGQGSDDGSDNPRGADLSELGSTVIQMATLCTSAKLKDESAEDQEQGGPTGDPTEIGIPLGAQAVGIDRAELRGKYEQVDVKEFDPHEKKMATYHKAEEGILVAVKGAPEAVLEVYTSLQLKPGEDGTHMTDNDRKQWTKKADQLALHGLQVLAIACKYEPSIETDPYDSLCFLGLIGLLDPPRSNVKDAIDTCQSAGIVVKMVTGDKAQTAKAIGESVGILGDRDDPEAKVLQGSSIRKVAQFNETEKKDILGANVFARASPEQKLDLISLYQDRERHIVAMTGDLVGP